jgi:glycosyl transferase family 25
MKEFDFKIPVFVINCKANSERYEKFKKFATKAKLKARRVECVDGRKFTDEGICDLIEKNIVTDYTFLTKIQIAICLSHYKCWEKIAKGDCEYGIILEDDVEVYSDFIYNINLILKSLKENKTNFSIINLWNGNWNRSQKYQTKILHINKDIQIMKENSEYLAGGVAYIITKKFAKYLLSKFFPIVDANDLFIGTLWKEGNHLSLKMKTVKKIKYIDDYHYFYAFCKYSPLLHMIFETDEQYGGVTTQDPDAENYILKIDCEN